MLLNPHRPVLFILFLLSRLLLTRADFGFISYSSVFFEPKHVLNNSWFDQAHWAKEMSQYWAQKLIPFGPWTVTNKTVLPASGNIHDYLSFSVYYWPNCSNVGNTTELPTQQVWDECDYYRLDGQLNPDVNEVQNSVAMQNLTDSIYLSALAYAATSSPVFSSHVNDALYTFFVNETTRMNPNINYGQVIRGPVSQTGRHTGVLDMKGMAKIVSAVELLLEMGAEEYQPETHQGLVSWATEMVEWLTTNELALKEKATANNHGTFYYTQLCSLYVLIDQHDEAVITLEEFFNSTFPAQILANGDQPLESARTRPYHYRAYNLAALVTNAQIGDYVGLDPPAWNRTSAEGATIVDALRYAMAQDPTTSDELDQSRSLNPVIAAIASKFGDPDGTYAAFLKSTDQYYPAQPWFALNEGIDNSGIRQGLIETTYGPVPAQPTAAAQAPIQERRRPLKRIGRDEV